MIETYCWAFRIIKFNYFNLVKAFALSKILVKFQCGAVQNHSPNRTQVMAKHLCQLKLTYHRSSCMHQITRKRLRLHDESNSWPSSIRFQKRCSCTIVRHRDVLKNYKSCWRNRATQRLKKWVKKATFGLYCITLHTMVILKYSSSWLITSKKTRIVMRSSTCRPSKGKRRSSVQYYHAI